MDILRITTAGSVDDGKSTLIGRLLYDTESVTSDRLDAIETTSRRKGLDFTDLSLLTDGLIAEREQGITIDVAHIYFSTARRKYIIADTPGHVEYTRNMITGASNASVSMILVDARKGVVEQTRRHFYIACLLRIKNVVVCINKMDLVQYDEAFFTSIQNNFQELKRKSGFVNQHIRFIPVAAKDGDNVVFASANMPWYKGETLLSFLESVSSLAGEENSPARFSVQYVIRPHNNKFHDFRGYAGKVISGSFAAGDEIMALPSRKTSKIKTIRFYDEEAIKAEAAECPVITLEDDIDISRGDVLLKKDNDLLQRSRLKATICWMEETPLVTGKMYLLQHGVSQVKAKVISVDELVDIHTLEAKKAESKFRLNDIGIIQLQLARPLFADAYEDNPANGSFILIDEFSNNTVAVGFVKE